MTILLQTETSLIALEGSLYIHPDATTDHNHSLLHCHGIKIDFVAYGTDEQMTNLLANIATTINLHRNAPHILINISHILTADQRRKETPS